MRVAVIGAGGVGGAFGAALARAGADVTFVARGAHLAAIRRSGLRIEGGRGETLSIRHAQPTIPQPSARSISSCSASNFGTSRVPARRSGRSSGRPRR